MLKKTTYLFTMLLVVSFIGGCGKIGAFGTPPSSPYTRAVDTLAVQSKDSVLSMAAANIIGYEVLGETEKAEKVRKMMSEVSAKRTNSNIPFDIAKLKEINEYNKANPVEFKELITKAKLEEILTFGLFYANALETVKSAKSEADKLKNAKPEGKDAMYAPTAKEVLELTGSVQGELDVLVQLVAELVKYLSDNQVDLVGTLKTFNFTSALDNVIKK